MGRGSRNVISFNNCAFEKFGRRGSCVEISYASTSDRFIFSHCLFKDAWCALDVINKTNINVSNCLFKNCGEINQIEMRHAINIDINGPGSKVSCIGNIFEDCPTPPIVECEWTITRNTYEEIEDHSDLYVLRDNVIKGNNQCNGQTFHPNAIYRQPHQ